MLANQIGSLLKQCGRVDLKAAFFDEYFCLGGVGSLKAHYDGNGNFANASVGINNSLSNPIATNDPTKNIHENCLYIRILEDDSKGSLHSLCVCSPAHIQKVCRVSTRHFNDVHGGHGEPRSVDHAADVAVELYKIQSYFGRADFRRIFFAVVA